MKLTRKACILAMCGVLLTGCASPAAKAPADAGTGSPSPTQGTASPTGVVPEPTAEPTGEPAATPTAAPTQTPGSDTTEEGELYMKGNFVNSFSKIVSRHTNSSSRAWRDGMVSGNGEIGYITSGEPYSDTFIFQHIYFNYPSSQPREIPKELTGQLEEARENVFNLNDLWKIRDANGNVRSRTYYYSFHPGHQLRLNSAYTDKTSDYMRWTNYETAETGVTYTDSYGEWKRVSFTSRADGVSITKIEKSSTGTLINMTVSIDKIDDMCKAWDGLSQVSEMKYKHLVPEDCSYIAQIAHYPTYAASELVDGGYGGVTYIIVEGANAKKTRIVQDSTDSMMYGENPAVQIENAEAVYLITVSDRSFEMTGKSMGILTTFRDMTEYALLDEMVEKTTSVAAKYTVNGRFSYEAALEPSAAEQKEEFNRVSFELAGDEEFADYDNADLIKEQRRNDDRINHEFMRRAYEQARYAMICCGGTSAPRLYGMWTGEWNPGWRGLYTLDANVNLQVSAMNTGNLGGDFQEGYITFFLRHVPDFMYNATMAYGMHDAIQVSVNADADRAMHVEYDNAYPFEYWNAGASWCLLPIYEYWQCYGNQQIPINEYMRFEDLQGILSVNDGGLTDEEFNAIKERGYLDLEKDILLPLLTKQANFWEQLVTPRYYTDVNGNACHDESKTELLEGEKYIIIPGYSPENNPIGYNSTITANASMDIGAARDGLDMVCALEAAVGREGWEEAVEKWQTLRSQISDYKYDSDGALREWAMEEYIENNNHRHLSHLYAAWPGYETQNDPDLEQAALIALDNRNKYNTGDATAGHGWMHKALVEARLKQGDGMMKSLLQMMGDNAYYASFMTDHDTNRRNDTYCTDTAFGTLGAVNEALVFSNTGQIEIIPALPRDWTEGTVKGLMARTQVEVTNLSWNLDEKTAVVSLCSSRDNNTIRLSCGEAWTAAYADGKVLAVQNDENGNYVELTLHKNTEVTVAFTLAATLNGTYTIEKDGQYLQVDSEENGSPVIWGEWSEQAYWNVENTVDGKLKIQSCSTGKYLTVEDGKWVQKNASGDGQLWSGTEFSMTRLTMQKEVNVVADRIFITIDGKGETSVTVKNGDTVQLGVVCEPANAMAAYTWKTDSIGNGVVSPDGILTCYGSGEFTVQAVMASGYTAKLQVCVTGSAKLLEQEEIKTLSASDDGYSPDWAPEYMLDGNPATAYSSKDDRTKKYVQAELKEAAALDAVYLIGRFTASDGEGTYAKRINGAKVYASNSKMNGRLTDVVLVGEVNGVTATSEFIPCRVELDTKGEKYQYYMIYLDTVNNGSNISMAIAEIAFYRGGANLIQEVASQVSATAGEDAGYAADKDVNTVFVIENQTEKSMAGQYILFTFDGKKTIDKIVVKKAVIEGNYWLDHALAVGCELQASADGTEWETIAVMNTWPDGTDHQSECVFEISDAKPYRYVRYIRTKLKNNSDYAYWKWASTDGGNRISLADIEFYTLQVD